MDNTAGVHEISRDGYVISTDRRRLDVDAIHRYLSKESYWATGRDADTTPRSIEGSLCFGLFAPNGEQAGFARVITDFATFGWVCDVFVLDSHKGRGLGKWLVQTIIGYPELRGLRRLLLATRDAHELYRRYGGFRLLAEPTRWMEKVKDAP